VAVEVPRIIGYAAQRLPPRSLQVGTVTAQHTFTTGAGDEANAAMMVYALTGAAPIAQLLGGKVTNTADGQGALTITLDATPASTSWLFGWRTIVPNEAQNTTATPGSGWNEDADLGGANPGYLSAQFQSRTGTASPDVVWDDTADNVPPYGVRAAAIFSERRLIASILRSTRAMKSLIASTFFGYIPKRGAPFGMAIC
jgi:hypothetical protein